MGLIEDAKAILKLGNPVVDGKCDLCEGSYSLGPTGTPFSHKPDCPWLAMPRIVAALEAAQAFLLALPEWRGKPDLRDHDDMSFGFCPVCGEPDGHYAGCEYQTLRDALAGGQ